VKAKIAFYVNIKQRKSKQERPPKRSTNHLKKLEKGRGFSPGGGEEKKAARGETGR